MFGRKKDKPNKPKAAAAAGGSNAPGVAAELAPQPAATDGVSAGDTVASNAPGTLPPLYHRPVPLSSDSHRALRLRGNRSFSFAAAAALVPLNAAEFPLASRHYPIVFGTQGNIALAVLGTSGTNTFVDQDGAWRSMTYVPAYMRRYPFLFLAAPEDRYVLSIDEAYDGFGDEGEPLFSEGDTTDLTRNALAFCQAYEREAESTAAFIGALSVAGIFSPDAPVFSRSSGRKLTVKGVRAVDKDALDALPDPTILEWRAKGWLPAIYAHLTSMSNWDFTEG